MNQLTGVFMGVVLGLLIGHAFWCPVCGKEMPEPPKKPPTPEPEPYPEPFVSWRVVWETPDIPASIALDMNPTTEKYLGTHEWVRLP